MNHVGKYGTVVRGMLIPGSKRLVDRDEPRRVGNLLALQLENLGFDNVGIYADKSDFYIWAMRPLLRLSEKSTFPGPTHDPFHLI